MHRRKQRIKLETFFGGECGKKGKGDQVRREGKKASTKLLPHPGQALIRLAPALGSGWAQPAAISAAGGSEQKRSGRTGPGIATE